MSFLDVYKFFRSFSSFLTSRRQSVLLIGDKIFSIITIKENNF